MSLNQYRVLREIAVAAWNPVVDPANDTDWVTALTNPTPANIPQLEFDQNTLGPTNALVFWCDFVTTATNVRVAPSGQTYDAQLIEIGNPQDPDIVVGAAPQNVAVAGCSRSAIPVYESVVVPNVGPGIYALRLTNWAGTDPGVGAGMTIRFFMRGL